MVTLQSYTGLDSVVMLWVLRIICVPREPITMTMDCSLVVLRPALLQLQPRQEARPSQRLAGNDSGNHPSGFITFLNHGGTELRTYSIHPVKIIELP